MCRGADPWFVPALVAVWGPTLIAYYRPPAEPPAAEVVAHALEVVVRERADLSSLAAAEASPDRVQSETTCTPSPCPVCPEEPLCSPSRAFWQAVGPSSTWGWFSAFVAVLAFRIVEGIFRSFWRLLVRSRDVGRRRPALPAIGHF